MINENVLLVKIVVFDSGLGSLSIIKKIQKIVKTDIVYFADQKNYPYGIKSQAQLASIIKKTINLLEEKFKPEIIVVASNTPSLMLNLSTKKIIDVKPPLKLAQKKSKSKRIGILATKSAINSKGLINYIKKNNIPKSYKIFKINGSNLVDLVESGKFLNQKNYCQKIIKKSLESIIISEKIDVITLSSTHLLFLKTLLKKEFPKIKFIDPGNIVATKVFLKIKNKQSKRNSLKIFTSGDVISFKKKLNKIGIKNNINFLST
jgi:glutamate racemase